MSEKRCFKIDGIALFNEDVCNLYDTWTSPDVIISDGAYGVAGFDGDPKTPKGLVEWYRDHFKKWAERAKPGTTLWFWNTEIGWAKVHPLLEDNGWEYMGCNTWNKGLQHIAGNCNLKKLRGFPVVTEICVQYVKKPFFYVEGEKISLKKWLRHEWDRAKLTLAEANEACGLANAGSRKYLTKDHLWYAPPPEHFEKLVNYANNLGVETGRPYFSVDGLTPLSTAQYANMFPIFDGKYGYTNVWDYPPLHSNERIRVNGSAKYVHLNQKPLDLMKLIIEVSSKKGGVIWEPFGGLFSASLAAYHLNRHAFAAEIDSKMFEIAIKRFEILEESFRVTVKNNDYQLKIDL